MTDSASRRDFLKGKSALDALQAKVSERLDESPTLGPVLALKRQAMACDFEVQLNTSASENDTEPALAALDLIEQLESQMTIYRPDSEVMAINTTAADGPVVVEPRLFEVLMLMDRLHRLTGGAYDGTSGPLSHAWGFSRRAGRLPTSDEITAARARVGWSNVLLDESADAVAFVQPGIEINLNSVGKGYALDRAAELLEAELVCDFLLHGGRSTLLARGTRRWLDGELGDGWGVGLRHPLRPAERIAEFRLRDGAFSTSGSGTQSFVHQGRRYGHLLDPRTGWPAEGSHSVSVIAPTGAEADALSTALYVLGADEGERLLADHPEWQALFVEPAEHADAVRLRPVNLPADAWKPLIPV